VFLIPQNEHFQLPSSRSFLECGYAPHFKHKLRGEGPPSGNSSPVKGLNVAHIESNDGALGSFLSEEKVTKDEHSTPKA
jgi:hypothetical protein